MKMTLLALAVVLTLSACAFESPYHSDRSTVKMSPDNQKRMEGPVKNTIRIGGQDGAVFHYVGDFGIVIRDFPSPMLGPVKVGSKDPDLMEHLGPLVRKVVGKKARMDLTLGGYLMVKTSDANQAKVERLLADLRKLHWTVPAPNEDDVPSEDLFGWGRFLTDHPEW